MARLGNSKAIDFVCLASLISLSLGITACSSSGGGTPATAASASTSSVAQDIGTVFVHAKASGLCADGQVVDSQVQVQSGVATLIRDNCNDIPAQSQTQVLVQTDPANSSYIVYNTLTYVNSLISFNSSVIDAAGNVYSLAIQTAPLTLVQYRLVTKYDAQGKFVWAKRLPTDLNSDLSQLRLTSAGSLMVVGKTYQQSKRSALFLGITPDGQLLTQLAFAPPTGQTANFRDAAVDSTGNIYAVAEVKHPSDNNVDCIIIKFSPTGQIAWQKSLTNLNAWISQIRLTTDEKELYVSGHFDTSAYLGGIAKFKSDGTQEWSSNLAGTVYSIENSFDGALMIAGIIQSSSLSFVAKLAGAGLVAWSTNFRAPDESLGYTKGITQRADGSFIVNGLAIRNAGKVVGTVTSLTSAGALDWSFEVARTGGDAFQDGESSLLDGKLWMPLRSTIAGYGTLSTLYRFADQAAQPTCMLSTVRSDLTSSDAGLVLAASTSFSGQATLSPTPSSLQFTDVSIKADIQP